MQKIIENLKARLHSIGNNGNLRSLKLMPSNAVDFLSNDYLGYMHNSTLHEHIATALRMHKAGYGSGGSRLLSGNSTLHMHLESELADFFHAEAALVFNSGYSANIGLLSTIPERHDLILYDERCHASIKDGMRLSLASKTSFRHNDLDHLAEKLERNPQQKFIVVESIYSMDGDLCPLRELVELAKLYDAALIVDEAHSTGIIGEHGAGLTVYERLEQHIFARIHTFGKAMGLHGACIVGSDLLKQYLINTARSFIYTTAMPGENIAAILATIKFIRDDHAERAKLSEIIGYFHQQVSEMNFDANRMTTNHGPIQFLKMKDRQTLRLCSEQLAKANINCLPILPPTVPVGEEGLRLCLHSHNTKAELDSLLNEIKRFI